MEKELSLSAWGVCGEAGRGGGGELSPSCGPEADAVGSTGASQTARGPGTRGWAPQPRGIPSLLTPGGPHAPAIPELIRSAHRRQSQPAHEKSGVSSTHARSLSSPWLCWASGCAKHSLPLPDGVPLGRNNLPGQGYHRCTLSGLPRGAGRQGLGTGPVGVTEPSHSEKDPQHE